MKAKLFDALYFEEALSTWPADWPVQVNVAEVDRVCDRQGSDKWFEEVLTNQHAKNEKHVYENAGHDLKADHRTCTKS